MIIGAVVYKLKALAGCKMPASHGRLLHASFLKLVQQIDPELSAVLHDEKTKHFFLNPLTFAQEARHNTYYIHQGDVIYWRISCIGGEILGLLHNVEQGTELRIGEGIFTVEELYWEQEQHPDAGVTSMELLVEGCSQLPPMRSLTINFTTPTLFRVDDIELPIPRTDLIFSSLSERWSYFCSEYPIDAAAVKELCRFLVPINWHGETKRYNITPKRGITGFVGEFTYDISRVEEKYRWVFILLAEFAVFVGIGRLTAQGLGNVDISYKQ